MANPSLREPIIYFPEDDPPEVLLPGKLLLPELLLPELLLPGELLPPEEELPLLPPGISAPPVAEPPLDRPKYENTLCLQPGWLNAVVGSKLGADCSLLASPENVKLTCPLLLLEEELPADEELLEEGRRSIQGTATCLPLELELDRPEELPLGLLLPPELESPDELLLGLVLLELPCELLELPWLLEEPGLVALPEEEPLGLLLLPELPLEFNDKTANSILPDMGLMIVSLIVPSVSPDEPVTFAPIIWLARNS